MSNERERRSAQDDHPPAGEPASAGSQDVLDSRPRQVAQVNMPPDELLDEPYDEFIDEAGQPASGAGPMATEHGALGGGWGPTAWLLGLLALVVSIAVLLFIMQGVFQSMPT